MKFGEIRTHYYDATGKASDIARQLAFAGFAAIWIFRQGNKGLDIPVVMMPAAIGFGLALIADALQYGIAARVWRGHADRADKVCTMDDHECEIPVGTNDWPRFFFALKLWLVGASYGWYIGSIAYLIWKGSL